MLTGAHEILEVLTDGARVAEIVVLLDELFHQRFVGSAPHLLEPEIAEGGKVTGQRRRRDLDDGLGDMAWW